MMEYLSQLLPIIIYILLIALIVLLIIISIKAIKALNKVQTVVDTVDKKVHSMNGALDVIDIATDKLSTFSDKLINIIAGAIEKVFKVSDRREIEEPKKETKKVAKKED